MKVRKGSLVDLKYETDMKVQTPASDTFNMTDTMRIRIGSRKIHRKFEKYLIGMEKNEEKEFNLMLRKLDLNLLIWKKKSDFAFPETVSKGKQIEIISSDGKRVIGTILVIKKNHIMIDLNHPLAGKIIHFNVKILNISS